MVYVLEKLVKDIVEELKDCQRQETVTEDLTIDIPQIIAPIVQAIHLNMLGGLEQDLHDHPTYSVWYDSCNSDYSSNETITIQFLDKDGYYLAEHYLITITHEDRLWGECCCTPDMEDYREDKSCCGHGCDWCAPMVKVEKVYEVVSHAWDGDEHNYWDFEDEFYKYDSESAEYKEKQEKEQRRRFLEEQISIMQKELERL